MIAIDTNLLVYAHRRATPEHQGAKRVLEKAAQFPSGWGFALPVLAEFWSVVTHPRASGRPSTHHEASSFIQSLVQGGKAQVWIPNTGFEKRLMAAAGKLEIVGVRVFDFQIAMIAKEAGARQIWTHDLNFAAPPGIEVRNPLSSGRG